MSRCCCTYPCDNVIACAVGVVVPLEGEFVTAHDADRLGCLRTSNVTGHSRRGNIGDGVVVWRAVDVSALLVSHTLVLSVHEDVPHRGVCRSGAGKGKSEN